MLHPSQVVVKLSEFFVLVCFLLNALLVPPAHYSVKGILVVHEAIVTHALNYVPLLCQVATLDS